MPEDWARYHGSFGIKTAVTDHSVGTAGRRWRRGDGRKSRTLLAATRGAVCLRIRVGGNRDLDPFAGRFRVPDRENPATGFLPKSELSADVIRRIVNGGGFSGAVLAV